MTASCKSTNPATQSLRDNQDRKALLKKDLQEKAIKDARNKAKEYTKDGFKTFIGGLPLDKQVENAWLKAVDVNETGLPEYVTANARTIGANTSAAKSQALHFAKVELAGLISSNIASLVESSVANDELSQKEAVSVSQAVQASKEIIIAELGLVSKDVEIYRDLPNKNVEVMVSLSYSSRIAAEAAKRAIQQKLEDKSEELHKKLDKMLGWDKQFGEGKQSSNFMYEQ
ncbi:hypothetical protein FACS189430_00620 [Bacteroidia bacterium]|nr:hypothetical protein FACS189430_00620 [Bacteroidia bacterium]